MGQLVKHPGYNGYECDRKMVVREKVVMEACGMKKHMRFKERKCGSHEERGVNVYMETGMRSMRMMTAIHVQK